MNLVIVESPTKSKTIQKFLKKGYKIVSSYGHVRDLPKTKLGVDPENNFEIKYVIPDKSKKTIKEIKDLAKKSDIVILATDPDREGEAISWHLAQTIGIDKKKYKRIVFHEITEKAVKEALNHSRDIDINLVNAQQTRRVLDRIVGYKLSPLLWKKIARGLSAGRVQSVALRFIVEKEREIEKFKKEEYWTIEINLEKKNKEFFTVSLSEIDHKKLDKLDIKTEKEVFQIVEKINNEKKFWVSKIESKEVNKNPLPPFTTSTLQQDAYKKLGMSSKMTMRVAQQLYEKGLTTYHRTDSLSLSSEAINDSKKFINQKYGNQYWKERKYKSKIKGAQEAHEAIRPSFSEKEPTLINELDKNQFKLYDLIWKRFIASQMSSAVFDQKKIEVKAGEFTFKTSGQTLKFDGFLKVYQMKLEEKELPDLLLEEILELIKVIPTQHFTQPPARYNEASLIKLLEQKGIGRPSTYSPTISVIQERNYVLKDENKKFYPTSIGITVNDLLVNHFPNIVDPEFTAKMEDDLDRISQGNEDWIKLMTQFYFPFEELIKKKEKELNKKDLTEKETDKICEKCGSKMVLKIGRFGEFLSCSNYPDCKHSESLEEEKEEETDPCEKCGSKMKLKRSRFGSFYGCSNYPKCKNIKKKESKTGIKCPKCNKGEIIQKKSKRGKFFYGCSEYPECDFITNAKPTGNNCPNCQFPLIVDKKEITICSNKNCSIS